MKTRLALDLGSTSLGWCLLEMNNEAPTGIKAMGVRIFPDGRDNQSKKPLAVARRLARGMRRNHDRRKWRRQLLMSYLVEKGLMPSTKSEQKELEKLDPYELRARAIKEKLSPFQIGRALFHINQRRGFKSNRKTDKKENDAGAMKNAIRDLDGKLMSSGYRTLGAYLNNLHQENKPVRVRRAVVGKETSYNFYPERKMYEEEVDRILKEQEKHHPILTEEICRRIKEIIFFQRPLKPAKVGNCVFENREPRARLALPIVQKFRILQEVNNLEIEDFGCGERQLTQEDRKKIIERLRVNRRITFKGLRKFLKLGSDLRFNLESDKRDELAGDVTSCLLSDDRAFGSRWQKLTDDEREKIVELLFEESHEEKLIHALAGQFGATPEQALYVSGLDLPDGYGRVSKKAIQKMLPHLEAGCRYAEAAKRAGYHHSDFRTGEVFDELPYYGQVLQSQVIGGSYSEDDKASPELYYGRINNPSVHIALNQLRKLVNSIIAAYGKPDEFVIELARDLKEPAGKILEEQSKNTKDNKRISAELEKLGVRNNYRNRMLYKLWEDLAKQPERRCCPFSGTQISAADIFSGKFEEEHLLPFSRSFNDGRANKVLSRVDWNRKKGNRSPFDAFGHEPFWPDIMARVQNLPANKQWRFKKDAWTRMEGEDGVIARMLNDTRYMSRLAKAYLSAVYDNEKGKSSVWASNGQLTALLRKKLGLNALLGEDDSKDRADHRHHAVDAFVVGLGDRGLLRKVSDAARRMETTEGLWEKRQKLVEGLEEPFPEFREKLVNHLETLVVSFKPDHGNAQKAVHAAPPYTIAPLHDQTACGFIGKGEGNNTVLVATRRPVESLEKIKHIEEIADAVIRNELLQAVKGLKEKSTEWKQALAAFTARTGTRRVRVHIKRSKDTLIGISSGHQQNNPYKYYATGGNYCAEIYCPDKGRLAGKWQCEVISNYDAHRKDFVPEWKKQNPAAKRVMRLQIDDMVAYEKDGETVIARVKKIAKGHGGRIYFRKHTVAKEEADKLSWCAFVSRMQAANLRKISVDIIGRVRDPRARVA